MKYAVGMGSAALAYMPSFVKTGSATIKLMGDSQTHRHHGDRISLLLFFQNKESGLEIYVFISRYINAIFKL
jgi:hypothetical protein